MGVWVLRREYGRLFFAISELSWDSSSFVRSTASGISLCLFLLVVLATNKKGEGCREEDGWTLSGDLLFSISLFDLFCSISSLFFFFRCPQSDKRIQNTHTQTTA